MEVLVFDQKKSFYCQESIHKNSWQILIFTYSLNSFRKLEKFSFLIHYFKRQVKNSTHFLKFIYKKVQQPQILQKIIEIKITC